MSNLNSEQRLYVACSLITVEASSGIIEFIVGSFIHSVIFNTVWEAFRTLPTNIKTLLMGTVFVGVTAAVAVAIWNYCKSFMNEDYKHIIDGYVLELMQEIQRNPTDSGKAFRMFEDDVRTTVHSWAVRTDNTSQKAETIIHDILQTTKTSMQEALTKELQKKLDFTTQKHGV